MQSAPKGKVHYQLCTTEKVLKETSNHRGQSVFPAWVSEGPQPHTPCSALGALQRGAPTSHPQGSGHGKLQIVTVSTEQNNSGNFCSFPEAALPSTPTRAQLQLLPTGDTQGTAPTRPRAILPLQGPRAHPNSIPSAVPPPGSAPGGILPLQGAQQRSQSCACPCLGWGAPVGLSTLYLVLAGMLVFQRTV